MANCLDQGKIQCPNGACADTLEDCPTIYEDAELDIGYSAEGHFIDDPTTTGIYADEGLQAIYEALGGVDHIGLDFQSFADEYASDFPAWTGSNYERKSDLIEGRIGLLSSDLELQRDKGRYESGQALGQIRDAREGQIRGLGGLQAGKAKSSIDSAYDLVMRGFNFGQDAIDIDRDQKLIDMTDKQLEYEVQLADVAQQFDDRMWDYIGMHSDKYKDLGDDHDAGNADSCGRPLGAPDYGNAICGTSTTDETDEHDDTYDGYDDDDAFDSYDDDYEGFDEDYEYEDYWEFENEYS